MGVLPKTRGRQSGGPGKGPERDHRDRSRAPCREAPYGPGQSSAQPDSGDCRNSVIRMNIDGHNYRGDGRRQQHPTAQVPDGGAAGPRIRRQSRRHR